MLYNVCNVIELSDRKESKRLNVGGLVGWSNETNFQTLKKKMKDFYAVRFLKEVLMKKFLVISALFLIPAFAFAAAGNSATATLNSTMTIVAAITLTQQQAMVFPTSVNGLSPTTWDTTMASAVAGGAAGTNGVMRIGSGATGSASLSLAATTLAGYPVTFAAVAPANTASISLSAATVDVTLKGTINAATTPFTAGTFAATTACTVTYL